MNISAISFGREIDSVAPAGDMPVRRPAKKTEGDTFTSTKKQAAKPSGGKHHLRPSIKGFIAGVLTPLTIMGGVKVNDAINGPKAKVTVPFDYSSSSITRVADTYGVDPEIITVYNNITQDTDMSGIKELEIPSRYDYLQGQIESNEAKLHKKGLSDTARMQLEEETLALKVKQEEQQIVAKAYTDGPFVYYLVNTPEESPDLVEKYGNYGISSEDFKALFDIKDGELKRFNDLSYNIRTEETGKGTSMTYKDYTLSSIKYGSLIKVYKNAVDEDDVTLKSFYIE